MKYLIIILLTISLKAQVKAYSSNYGDTTKVMAFTPVEFLLCDSMGENCDTLTYVGWEEAYRIEYDFETIYLGMDKKKFPKEIFFTVPIYSWQEEK